MFSEGQKRRASLSVLEKLRGKGMPSREASSEEGDEEMDSMFARVDEKKLPDIEVEDDTATPPEPVLAPPANKKKGPRIDQEKAKQFMKAFKGVK